MPRQIIRATDHLINPSYVRRTDANLRMEPRHLKMLRDLYGAGWRSEFGRQLELCSVRGFVPKPLASVMPDSLEMMSFPVSTHHWEQLCAMWWDTEQVAAGLVEHLAGGAAVPWPKAVPGYEAGSSARQSGTVTRSGNRVLHSLSLELWLSDRLHRLRGLHTVSEFVGLLIRRAQGVEVVEPPQVEDIRDKVKVPVNIWLTPDERASLDKVPGGRRRAVQQVVKEMLANKKGEWL